MGKFELGNIYTTAAVFDCMCIEDKFGFFVENSLNRFKNCDWGDSDKEDKTLNDEAVINNV